MAGLDDAVTRLGALARAALGRGDTVLTEPELYEALATAGLPVPARVVWRRGQPLVLPPDLASAPRLVVKVVSRDVLHKSDVGGVRFVAPQELTEGWLGRFVDEVADRAAAAHGRRPAIDAALVMERVDFDAGRPGAEIIVGLRWSRDLGFVGMIGLGGVKAELFGGRLPRLEAAAIFDPLQPERALAELRRTLVYRDLAGALRGSQALVDDDGWRGVLALLAGLARAFPLDGAAGAVGLEELELNPVLVDRRGRLVPVDALARLARAEPAAVRPPVDKLRAFFEPQRVCVAGVSSKGVNMGRIILRNLLRDGFGPEQLTVLKPGEAEIDGVRCVPTPAALPERVDLAVLAVAADAVPDLMAELVAQQKAEGVIVIPGGMGETKAGVEKQARVHASLLESRRTAWRGPVVCGPNSMGVVSAPGHYDTTFIPAERLPPRTGPLRNLAFLSQSGAFTITRGSHLAQLAPRYLVSAGNQMDVSLGEFVAYAAADPQVQVIAAYVEGFQEGDGRRFLAAAEDAQRRGKRVLLYKGGRSPEGQGTAAGHTAAIAGDYRACWHLARAAGVLVAESFAEFEGLARVACALAGRRRGGRRVMLMSNAGFEVVGMADGLRGETYALELAALGEATRARFAQVLERAKISGLVEVKNPLDVTPSAPDAAHLELARAALEDPGVDALVVGVVPMSPALAALPAHADPAQTLAAPQSLARALPALFRETEKPVVVVVDAGRIFQPLVDALEAEGLPVFRRADEAVRALGSWLVG